jgi:hypothetical protein
VHNSLHHRDKPCGVFRSARRAVANDRCLRHRTAGVDGYPNGEGGESNDKKQFTPWDKHFWGRLKLPDETTDVLGRPLEQQASLQRAGPGAGILGSSSAVHKVEGEASLRIKLASGLTPDGGIKSKGCFSGKSVSIERLRLSQAL